MLVVAGCGGGGSKLHGDLLIAAARLFDGTTVREPGAVLIRGSKIVAVGGKLDATAATTRNLGDATILPGFIDLHVHAFSRPVTGVTTVRDLGIPLRYLRPPGVILGLRALMAGPLITVPGGYPTPSFGASLAYPVASPAAARRAVDRLARRGAAVIKIALDPGIGVNWPMLTVAETRAIVAEAHGRHLHVVAHAFEAGIAIALAAHVDELAHTPCGATPQQAAEIGRRHLPVVATLHVEEIVFHGCTGVAQEIERAGGRLLYGTDLGNRGIPYGIDVEELRLLRTAGLTPTQVLAAATSAAGEDLGLAPLGTLTSGAPADVIAVRGDARRLALSLAHPLLAVSEGDIRSF